MIQSKKLVIHKITDEMISKKMIGYHVIANEIGMLRNCFPSSVFTENFILVNE